MWLACSSWLVACAEPVAPQPIVVMPAPVYVEVHPAPATPAPVVQQVVPVPSESEPATAPSGTTLSRQFTSDNGLIVVGYPHHWKAKLVAPNVIQVLRSLPNDEDENLTFISLPTPVTQDLKSFNDIVINAEIPHLTGYSESSRKASKCVGGAPGVEILSTWVPPNGITYLRWTCTFLLQGHGYSFAYDLPQDKVTRDDTLMQSMIQGVRFTQP